MTEQTIPADQVRKIIARYRDGANDQGGMILADLEALLPTTTRPTLDDMTDKERDACRRMQADVEGMSERYVIIHPRQGAGAVAAVSEDGEIKWFVPGQVTPRPDLPRMEWPAGDQEAEDVPPAKVGDVIESADDPRISALPVGSILGDRDGVLFSITKDDTGEWAGPGYLPVQGTGTTWGPWTVRRIGKKADQ